MAEQSSLRQIATLVAAGRAAGRGSRRRDRGSGMLFGAAQREPRPLGGGPGRGGRGRGVGRAGSTAGRERSLYHPDPHGPTLARARDGGGMSRNRVLAGARVVSVIAAPVIATRTLFGALTAARAAEDPFPAGAEIRLRSFADLAAQSIANERAQAELRASRARIVQTADEARRRLERNLHDGAQQRLVSVSLALRLVERMFETDRGNGTRRAARGVERARGGDAGVARTRARPASGALERARPGACARRALRPLALRRRGHRCA